MKHRQGSTTLPLGLAAAVLGLAGSDRALAAESELAAGRGPASAAATCSAAQKRTRVRALSAFRSSMAKQRAAYFKAHLSPSMRAAFVKRQRAELLRLQARAACTIPDRTPPRLSSATVNADTVKLSLSEDLAAPPSASAFSVTVDGLRWRIAGARLEGKRDVVLRLAIGVTSTESVVVTYTASSLADRAGNATRNFSTTTRNVTPAAPATAEPGFAPSLPKPGFADDRSIPDPWVGEWGPKSDPYWLPSRGTHRGLIIPVDFADAPATRTVEFYRDYLVPTAQRYYGEVSYGRFELQLATVPRWLRLARTAAQYAAQWRSPDGRKELLREATALVDAEVDFATVDSIYVIAPESVAGSLGLSLVRAWPGDGPVRDGRELRWAVVGGAGLDPRGPTANLAAHHIVTHELGHFLGLPDLYDQARRGTPDQFAWAGRWDNMSDNRASSHLFTWHKWLLGWLDATQLRGLTAPGTTEAELTPLERRGGLKAVVVPVSTDVAYVVENRQRIGEDIELCGDGVLVWVVDGSRRNVEHNAVVQPAGRSYSDECGAIFDAAYGTGPGKLSVFEDANVRMEVLAVLANGNVRVRVTKR